MGIAVGNIKPGGWAVGNVKVGGSAFNNIKKFSAGGGTSVRLGKYMFGNRIPMPGETRLHSPGVLF